jgi:hypothetical protein
MKGFSVWRRWQCTHRLSSGDRLSVKKEQFWFSISANLDHRKTHTHTHRERERDLLKEERFPFQEELFSTAL